jgi:hypothetical protein
MTNFSFGRSGVLWAIVDATVVAVLAVMLAADVGGKGGAKMLLQTLWVCVVGSSALAIVTLV